MEENLTLRAGIARFHKKNKKYFAKRSNSEAGEAFLADHDVAHIVFGCDTTIYGEGVVKIWTTFGTNLSFWKVINGYQEASAFELFRRYSFGHILKNILRFMVVIPKVIVRAKRMSKPWPFSGYSAYLDTPLVEIRKAFNIQIVE